MEISPLPREIVIAKGRKDHTNVGGVLNWAERNIHSGFDRLLEAFTVITQDMHCEYCHHSPLLFLTTCLVLWNVSFSKHVGNMCEII